MARYGDPMLCRMSTRDPEIRVGLPVELELECPSPTSNECRCSGRDCGYLAWVEAYWWRDYWDRYWKGTVMVDHVLVSSRWVRGCNIHTRVYIRSDGALVFSHDTAGSDGVHVLVFDGEVAEKLRALYRSLRWGRDHAI